MKKFTVTGMSCAACSARVEKVVSAVPGVTSCSVSLLTNTMGVEGDFSDKDIQCAVVFSNFWGNASGRILPLPSFVLIGRAIIAFVGNYLKRI